MSRSGTYMLLLAALLFLSRLPSIMADPKTFFYGLLCSLPGIIIGLTVHEFGHAFTAYKLGDPTPKVYRRVTLNPASHIDPIGLVALLFGGFGWGRPVMIDPNGYRHPRRDRLLVSIAGVTMNAIMIIVFALITKAVIYLLPGSLSAGYSFSSVLLDVLLRVIMINIVLMLFNILPVPPLDGFNAITEIFNLRAKSWYQKVYNAGGIILIIIVLFRFTRYVLSPAAQAIYEFVLTKLVI